jgi:hypothetical protein
VPLLRAQPLALTTQKTPFLCHYLEMTVVLLSVSQSLPSKRVYMPQYLIVTLTVSYLSVVGFYGYDNKPSGSIIRGEYIY